MKLVSEKKAQVAIFVIIAVVIVAGIFLLVVFKDDLFKSNVPKNFEPVYNSFLGCLEQETKTGIDVLESQGGYIELPNYEPGNPYSPFSSYLDFFGNPIPYWYYTGLSGEDKEQVPSKADLESELETFLKNNLRNCVFDEFYKQGFEVFLNSEDAEFSVNINSNTVEVISKASLKLGFDNSTATFNSHKIVVDSALGQLYDTAKEVYDYEQKELFLEDYGIDILRLYAPVDGVELTCAPMVWNAEEVLGEVQQGVESNMIQLKTNNVASKRDNPYFVLDLDTSNEVRFLNFKSWPYTFEVTPAEGSVLKADPVGNQPGLGVLGFCYVNYHFIYNFKYPVLVQVSSGQETFQFPMAVVIQNNFPRAERATSGADVEIDNFCNYANTLTEVNVYDSEFNPVNAEIYYQCSGSQCYLGKSKDGFFEGYVPQCVNGVLRARADGFLEGKKIYSSVNSGNAEIFLNALHNLKVSLKVNGKDYFGPAILSLISNDSASTVVLPDDDSVSLASGQYEIVVYVYRNSSLKIPASTQTFCVDKPKSGVGSLFGLTEEECFDVETGEQIISNALSGGGKQNYYFTEEMLKNSEILEINVESFPVPDSLERLQENYLLFEDKHVGVSLK